MLDSPPWRVTDLQVECGTVQVNSTRGVDLVVAGARRGTVQVYLPGGAGSKAERAAADDFQDGGIGQVYQAGEDHVPGVGGADEQARIGCADAVQFGVGEHELAGTTLCAQVNGTAGGGGDQ